MPNFGHCIDLRQSPLQLAVICGDDQQPCSLPRFSEPKVTSSFKKPSLTLLEKDTQQDFWIKNCRDNLFGQIHKIKAYKT